MSEAPRHVEETPVRQGRTGTGLRWVLRISLALIVVAFAAIWLAYATRTHPTPPEVITSTTPNRVKEAAATAPPGSVPAQAVGRREQTTGG
jgi:hypothetical protein